MTDAARMTPAQRDALALLSGALGPSSYLAGGTAVAVRLRHRVSHDIDLFVPDADPVTWLSTIEGLDRVIVISRSEGTVYLEVAGVPVSIMRYGYPLLVPPSRVEGVPVPVASLDDLAAMKLSAIAGRGAKRDFWDLHEMIASGAIALPEALAAFSRKYRAEDVGHVVKSLVYFADAEAEPDPTGLTAAHWEQVEHDLRAWVIQL